MKRKVSLKLFLTVVWRAICQVLQFVAKLFGYKGESTYAKVVWRIFAGCVTALVALLTFCILYMFATDVVYKDYIRPLMNNETYVEKYISNQLVFQREEYSWDASIYDVKQKKVVLDDVDWVFVSDDLDSLAVFARGNKRGYINRFTGEIAIPESFTRAWVFSEGLAAVEKDNELVFIDHSGKVVIDKGFQAPPNKPKYSFRNGYCVIKDPVTDKLGLIDKTGEWALRQEYDALYNTNGLWKVEKEGLEGLFTAEADTLFPVNNYRISISDSTIEVRHADHTAKRYDFNGNVLVDFVIDEVIQLRYATDELREDAEMNDDGEINDEIYAIANRQKYRVSSTYSDDYYGLMSKDGKRITPPIYTYIKAIAKDRYLCQPQGVIIDDNGQIVE